MQISGTTVLLTGANGAHARHLLPDPISRSQSPLRFSDPKSYERTISGR